MYGSIANQHSGSKATGVAAACGFAAVVAVAGLVGYAAQPSALYTASAVRPAVQVAVGSAAVQPMAARIPMAAPAAYTVVEEPSVSVNVAGKVASFWPVALGVGAMAAVFSFVLGKKQSSMEPIAMAATSGDRLVWFPGATPAAHLTGQYPGDRGFDPLGFSKDPKIAERMRISEVFHGRLAMLGVVGCLFPEALLHKATWFEAWNSLDQNKFGLIAMQCIAPLEYWRGNGGFGWNGGENPDRSYPGFDPLGITTEDTKLREIKNGRLAMTAMLGFAVQYQVTGKSPLANLAAHLADPIHANFAAGSVAMFATGGERKLWFPGGYAPPHLTGEFPGDRGFDPFGLATDPKIYARMRISEVFHGRLCMLAVLGAVTQELAGKGAWYNVPDTADMGLEQLLVFIGLCGLPEYWRGNGGFSKDAMDKSYPGFDPLKLTTDYTKEAEIKNGRLAITAMAGFWVQHLVTKQSPLENFVAHWYNPLGANIAANLAHPVAMFATAGHKDGVWFPGAKPAAHLTGEYPADRGFDPLSLAHDPTVYARMRLSEVFHGRLAMLGVVGCLVPEILGKGAWFDAGSAVDGTKLGFIAMCIAAPTEYWRGQGGFGWDKGTFDRSYPGFDPLNLTNDRNKTAEIKNGRLAMAAIAGFAAQAKLTGQSPLAALAAHLSNPLGANIITSHTNLAMFSTSGDKARPLWFPNGTPAAHLTGEYPADRGFDPFGLAADPNVYARMRVSEVFHGRLAMLGVVGCLWPEILGKAAWYDIGDVVDVNRFGVIAMQVIAPLEYWRGNGGFGWNGETEGRDRSYPGFDPLGITDDSTKAAEIKNGRLAMMALAGFAVQHAVTGQSPIQNFVAHLNDPVGANIAANLMNPPVAMFATAGHKDGVWFPGAKPAAHLTGEYPADRGFDPLSLAHDPTVYARMRLSEVFHGRLAMLGVVGCLVPEILGKGAWFDAGSAVDGTKLGFIAMCIAAPTEYWRGQGGFGWDKGTFDRSYPGFDPLKLTNDRNKTAEIKNGRLAMAAIAGFAAQAKLTGQSPLAALAAHLSNPLGANIITSHTNLAMF